MQEDRIPALDASTWEVLLEIYELVAAADRDKGALAATDAAFIHGQLKTLLLLNSIAPNDPRADAGVLERIKKASRSLLP